MNIDTIKNPLFVQLSELLMPKHLRIWSPDKPLYNNLQISKEDIPELINLVSDIDLFESEDKTEFWVPVHAWRILCELGATVAVPTLISLFDEYHDSDYASEELYKVVAVLSKGQCLKELTEHVMDKSKDLYSRTIALNAIDYIAQKYSSYKDKCIDALANCLSESTVDWKELNAFIIESLIYLKASTKIDVIRKTFYDDIVALYITGDLEDVEISLGLRTKRDTPKRDYFRERLSPILNYLNMKDKKIGRNEPCPCGSGKKYKKCCI